MSRSNGHNEVIDATCCCGGGPPPVPCCCCPGTQPTSMTVQFTADLNASGPGCGESGNCNAWISSFDLPQLTVEEFDYMVATWPTTYSDLSDLDCYYGIFTGLPCNATSMVYHIVDCGADGSAVAIITIGWADGVFVEITLTHSADNNDCCTNFTRPNEGCDDCTVGVSASAGVPCDFALAATGGQSDIIVTANGCTPGCPFICPDTCDGCPCAILVDISGLTGGCAAMNTNAGFAGPLILYQTTIGGVCGWAGSSPPIDSDPLYAIRWEAFINCTPQGWTFDILLESLDANITGYDLDADWTGTLGTGNCPSMGAVANVICNPIHGGPVCDYAPYPPGPPPRIPCPNLPTITLTALSCGQQFNLHQFQAGQFH